MNGYLDMGLRKVKPMHQRLIPHIFFPRKLPSATLGGVGKDESALLSLISSVTQSFAGGFTQTDFPKTVQLFSKWPSIQLEEGLDVERLTAAIQEMGPGDSVAVYVRAQNAGLFLCMSKNHDAVCHTSDQVVLSAFAASQSNERVMGTEGTLRSVFPNFPYHIPKSTLLKSNALGRHLSNLSQKIEDFAAEHTVKTGRSHQENRNVSDPVFISQWLPAALSVETSDLCSIFATVTKKIRDKVVHGSNTLPFRRSGLWMTAKVVLHLSLINEMGDEVNATFLYKMIMLKLMCTCVEMWNQDFDADIGMQMIAKIARRMVKLHHYAQKCTISPALSSYFGELSAEAENLVLGVRQDLDDKWKSYIALKSRQSELNYKPPLNFEEHTIHGLKKLNVYLEMMRSRVYKNPTGVVPNLHCPPRHRFHEDIMFPIQNFEVVGEESLGIVINDFERNMEKLKTFYDTRDVLVLRDLFEKYAEKANNYYKDDPVGGSRMILTLLEMIRVLDKYVVEEHTLLAQYKSGIDPSIIKELILPSPKEMKLALALEKYFETRNSNATYGSLISGKSLTSTSFSVKYGAQNPEMQSLKEQIQTECRDKQDKKKTEVLEKRKLCRELRIEANGLSHEYREDRYGRTVHSYGCSKCFIEKREESMKVDLYEKKLPESGDHQNGVVFELMIASDIVCLRDMLFRFTKLCSKRNEGGEPPQGYWIDHLSEYWSDSSKNQKYVKLGSSTKLCLVTHHSRGGLHPDSDMDSFIVPNGYNCKYYYDDDPSSPSIPSQRSVKKFCTFKVNPISAYQNLQFALSWTSHSQNQVLARQVECPAELALSEFIEFGSIRAGHRLQWHNVHRAIVQDSLSLEADSVFNLICQTVWQAGPQLSSGNEHYWRETDLSIIDNNFAIKTLQLLKSELEKNSCNWKNDHFMAVIIVLTTRIFCITPNETVKKVALELIKICRQVTEEWCVSIEFLLTKMTEAKKEDVKEMRMKLVQIAALSALTFTANREDALLVLSDSADVQSWLTSITKIHDNILLTESSLTTMPITLRNLLRWVRKVGVELEDHFRELSGISKGFDDFLATQLSQALMIKIHKYEHPIKQVYRGESVYSVYQVDTITGLFHVNGRPVGKLPYTITSHPDFQRVFSSTIFEVREATGANSIPGSFSTVLKFNNCIYNFYMAEGNELIITEIHDEENAYQLISHSRFDGDIPYLLVHKFSHWHHLKSEVIHFRPIDFLSPQFTQPSAYKLDLLTRELIQTTTNRNIVDINTTTFKQLARVLQRLEHIDQILVFSDERRLIAELPRMALHFSVDVDVTGDVIQSKEYSRMCISNTQQLDTLVGLQNGLLLKSLDFDDYTMASVLLVPNGSVSRAGTGDTMHHIVAIETNNLGTPQYFAFEVDARLRRLRAGQSRIDWLYLAYLYAVTASPMPDPFTEMTGTEVALQLLQSPLCWSCQPLDGASIDILNQISELSPRRVYYPGHLEVMERSSYPDCLSSAAAQDSFRYITQKIMADSQRLSFLFPGASLNCQKLDGYNEKLCRKAYRNHVLVSNELNRIDPEFTTLPVEPETRIVSSASTHRGQQYLTSVRELAQCCAAWTCTATPNNNLLVKLLGSSSTPTLEVEHEFPESNFYEKADLFKKKFPSSWFNLYEIARAVKSRGWKSEWSLLSCQLGFGNRPIPNEHIRLLHAVAVNPEVFKDKNIPTYETYTSPQDYTYESTEVISIAKAHAKDFDSYFARMNDSVQRKSSDQDAYVEKLRTEYNCLVNDQSKLLSRKLDENWPISSCDILIRPGCISSHYEVINILGAREEVNAKLEQWFSNLKLREFLIEIEGLLQKVSQLSSVVTVAVRPYEIEDYAQNPSPIPCVDSNDVLSKSLDEVMLENEKFVEEKLTQFANQIFRTGGLNSKDLIPQFKALSINQNKYRAWTDQLFKSVKTALLTPTDSLPFKGTLAAAGLFPPLTPTTLIPKIVSDHLENNRIRELLGAMCVLWTLEQKEIRCEKYKHAGGVMQFALTKELENNGHDYWNPAERPEWLILELEMDIMIREIQVEVAERMMNPLNNKSSLMQLNMGEGKTSVILPILIASLANGRQLARVTVLKSLFHTNTEVLRFNLGGLLKRRLYNFPCRRDMVIHAEQGRSMLQVYQECASKRGFVVTLPEHRLSFQLKGYEKCRARASSSDAAQLVGIQEWLYQNARDVLDESDEILNVKYQLIYTIGEQLPIDGGSLRWTVLQKLLKLVPDQLRKLINSDSGINDLAECRNINSDFENGPEVFPRCRIFKSECYEALCTSLVDEILSGKTEVQLPEMKATNREDLKIFITKPSLESSLHERIMGLFEEALNLNQQNTLLILRGILACGVVLLGLTKRWRVNYGENPKAKEFSRLMAVPYRAKDVASEKTEFGHPDVAILLTQLSYYYSGLSDAQLTETFVCLNRQPKPELEYSSWISQMTNVDETISSLSGVNLDDYDQRTKILFPALRRNTLVIDFWLNHFVYPRESKVFGHKLMASPWDLSSNIAKYPVTGFSGTNGTAKLLPLHISQNDLPKLETTNEKVRGYILQEENNCYEGLPAGFSGLDILKKLVDMRINLLLDVGALILELSNVEVAETWLKLLTKVEHKHIEAAVYFDSMDRLMVKDRNGRETTLELSPYRMRLSHCVIYLDDVHTRGTDLKLPPGTKGCVTLGKGVTRDKLVQGCMRMRQLGMQNGHSLQFMASREVHNEITEIPGSRWNERVMCWASVNSETAIKDGFLHWVNAGVNYVRKHASHDLLLHSTSADTGTLPNYTKYGERCSDTEATQLMAMYGEFRLIEYFYKIAEQRLNLQESTFESTLDEHEIPIRADILKTMRVTGNAIVGKCQEHIPELKKLAYLLDEEQERELEHELEEERQAPPPPAAQPWPHVLDPELKKFVEGRTSFEALNSAGSLVTLPYAFHETKLWSYVQENCWGKDIYATPDFSRSVKLENKIDRADQYLRPPNWFASFKTGNRTVLVYLSPFEANELMPTFRSGNSKLKLHMFAPRLHPTQDTLLRSPELWIPSATNFNYLDYFQEFNQLNSNILLFSGSQYFADEEEQAAYCQLTGYIPRPRTAAEQEAFDNDWTVKGFVKPRFRERLDPSLHANCKFETNPEELIFGIIDRRHQSCSTKCHVSRIVADSSKEIFGANIKQK